MRPISASYRIHLHRMMIQSQSRTASRKAWRSAGIGDREGTSKFLWISSRLSPLLALEPVARELERAAVLCDRTDDMFRDPSGDLCVDLQRHPHRGPDEPDEMRNDLVGDLAGVTPGTRRIEGDRAVKASGSGRRGRTRRGDRRRYRSGRCDRARDPATRLGRRSLCVDLPARDLRAHQQAGVAAT